MKIETKADLHQLIDGCPDYYSAEKVILHIVNNMLHNSIHVSNIINERATYLESYLDGTMYQEDKPEYREIQKQHAEYIKDLSEALLTDSTQKVIEANYEKYRI